MYRALRQFRQSANIIFIQVSGALHGLTFHILLTLSCQYILLLQQGGENKFVYYSTIFLVEITGLVSNSVTPLNTVSQCCLGQDTVKLHGCLSWWRGTSKNQYNTLPMINSSYKWYLKGASQTLENERVILACSIYLPAVSNTGCVPAQP